MTQGSFKQLKNPKFSVMPDLIRYLKIYHREIQVDSGLRLLASSLGALFSGHQG
jgi:hypothetical protein